MHDHRETRKERVASAPLGRGTAHNALTPKEERVAALVATGASTPQVASALGVSPKTVEAHLFRIYRKLGIRSRSDIAVHLSESARSPRP